MLKKEDIEYRVLKACGVENAKEVRASVILNTSNIFNNEMIEECGLQNILDRQAELLYRELYDDIHRDLIVFYRNFRRHVANSDLIEELDNIIEKVKDV